MPTLKDFAAAKHLVNSHHGYTLEAAIADAFAAERERCAKIADGFTCGACGMDGKVGAAIRAVNR